MARLVRGEKVVWKNKGLNFISFTFAVHDDSVKYTRIQIFSDSFFSGFCPNTGIHGSEKNCIIAYLTL